MAKDKDKNAPKYETDRLERAIIGHIAKFPKQFYMVEDLHTENFANPQLRAAFIAIKEMVQQRGTAALLQPAVVLETLERAGIASDQAIALLAESRDFAPAEDTLISPVVKELLGIGMRRSLVAASGEIKAIVEGGGDPDAMMADAQALISRCARRHIQTEVTDLGAQLDLEVRRIQEHDEQPIEMSTGLHTLDDWTTGYHPGELWIYGARPAVGKTAVLVNQAMALAFNQQIPGLLCSQEMRSIEVTQRIIGNLSNVSVKNIRRRCLTADQRQAYIENAQILKERSKLLLCDAPRLTAAQIRSMAHRYTEEFGIRWMMIDYIQLCDHQQRKNENRAAAVGRTSNMLKAMALELNISIICASQLNRSSEARQDKRPQLPDLRESGDIEQDADGVILLYRESAFDTTTRDTEHRNFDASQPVPMEFIIAKQRNGSIGTLEMQFIREYGAVYAPTFGPPAVAPSAPWRQG